MGEGNLKQFRVSSHQLSPDCPSSPMRDETAGADGADVEGLSPGRTSYAIFDAPHDRAFAASKQTTKLKPTRSRTSKSRCETNTGGSRDRAPTPGMEKAHGVPDPARCIPRPLQHRRRSSPPLPAPRPPPPELYGTLESGAWVGRLPP